MEPDVNVEIANPWMVKSLYDYLYYCCPECETKWQGKHEFVQHAFHHHPVSVSLWQEIKDESMQDVKFPDDVKLETKSISDQNDNDELVKKEDFKDDFKYEDLEMYDDSEENQNSDNLQPSTFSCDSCDG